MTHDVEVTFDDRGGQFLSIRPVGVARAGTRKRAPLKVKVSKRQEIYDRDSGRCAYCSTRLAFGDITLDHVIPRSRGGRNTMANRVVACQSCNLAKGDTLPKVHPLTRQAVRR